MFWPIRMNQGSRTKKFKKGRKRRRMCRKLRNLRKDSFFIGCGWNICDCVVVVVVVVAAVAAAVVVVLPYLRVSCL